MVRILGKRGYGPLDTNLESLVLLSFESPRDSRRDNSILRELRAVTPPERLECVLRMIESRSPMAMILADHLTFSKPDSEAILLKIMERMGIAEAASVLKFGAKRLGEQRMRQLVKDASLTRPETLGMAAYNWHGVFGVRWNEAAPS